MTHFSLRPTRSSSLSFRAIIFSAVLTASASLGDENRPNILLAISDDQSFPHASAYGDRSVHTPGFDRVAREGVLFMQAFAASPGCSPSRASLLTGLHTWQIEHAGTHASSFSAKYATYPDLMERAGYFVGYTGKGWGPGNAKAGGRERNPAGPSFSRHKVRERLASVSSNDYAKNFADFLENRPSGKPFCFWYGASEPHRRFTPGSGRAAGKKLDAVTVPAFLPDTETVRDDLLDYAIEIEWFDAHLVRMLKQLEAAGELDDTLIIVTSDNGMSFPRAKANVYEHGIHVPLAIRWGSRVPGGRRVDDLVGFVDLTATILDAAGVEAPRTPAPPVGRSLVALLSSKRSGIVEPERNAVYSARERHSSSRYLSLGYPQRSLRTQHYLYIRNFRPERWPAGAPQKYRKGGNPSADQLRKSTLGPLHGAYHDIDACPTLTFLVERRDDPEIARFFHLAVDRRPAEELFDIRNDPACLKNLAADPARREVLYSFLKTLNAELEKTGDTRARDRGDVWESYERYSKLREFPPPDWAREHPDRVPPQIWHRERISRAKAK